VFSRPCEHATRSVVNYLARYSHRTAISNQRILALDEATVSFHYKDYGDGDRQKVMHLSPTEFIRRFLLHVLPKRFVRIRHYGLMAGRNVDTRLARCRALLKADDQPATPDASPSPLDQPYPSILAEPATCPRCRGLLRRWTFDAGRATPRGIAHTTTRTVAILDSS
jgi:hypothetical protein